MSTLDYLLSLRTITLKVQEWRVPLDAGARTVLDAKARSVAAIGSRIKIGSEQSIDDFDVALIIALGEPISWGHEFKNVIGYMTCQFGSNAAQPLRLVAQLRMRKAGFFLVEEDALASIAAMLELDVGPIDRDSTGEPIWHPTPGSKLEIVNARLLRR